MFLGISKEAFGTGGSALSYDGKHLTLYQGETGLQLDGKEGRHPYFHNDLSTAHRKRIKYTQEPSSRGRTYYQAELTVPVKEIENNPYFKDHLNEARRGLAKTAAGQEMVRWDPRAWAELGERASSGPAKSWLTNMVSKYPRAATAAATGTMGAVGGAGLGALASDKGKRRRGAAVGAAVGGLGGGLAGGMYRHNVEKARKLMTDHIQDLGSEVNPLDPEFREAMHRYGQSPEAAEKVRMVGHRDILGRAQASPMSDKETLEWVYGPSGPWNKENPFYMNLMGMNDKEEAAVGRLLKDVQAGMGAKEPGAAQRLVEMGFDPSHIKAQVHPDKLMHSDLPQDVKEKLIDIGRQAGQAQARTPLERIGAEHMAARTSSLKGLEEGKGKLFGGPGGILETLKRFGGSPG